MSNIQVTINGEPRELPRELSVSQLILELKIKTRAIAVERNGELIEKSNHSACLLKDGDQLEIVTLVGGG